MTAEITPERRQALSSYGRLGGLTRAARHDSHAATAQARAAQAAGFLYGHGPCKVCPDAVEIPRDLPMDERKRRAAVLKKLHYTRMGLRRQGHL